MAKFSIIDVSTGLPKYSGTPRYNGAYRNVSTLVFAEVSSPTPIEWNVGDYVEYTRTGLRYGLKSIPEVSKSARSGEYGGSFVYRNVTFYSATKDLLDCPFQDLVVADNTVHYSSSENISTYENVEGIARRIQACLASAFPASNWVVSLYTQAADITAYMAEPREFTMTSGQSCLDALNQIYSVWKGIGWIHTYNAGTNTILIGRPNKQDADNTTSPFLYGKGNGLTLLKRSVSTVNEMATRIYPFGSTENMISRYYNGNSAIKDYQSVHIPNLMIPVERWGKTDGKYDPHKAYIEDTDAIAMYGLLPKEIRFTGGEFEEIKPSLEGITAKNLRDAMPSGTQYRPSSAYADAERMDELKSVVNPSDNGVQTDSQGVQYIKTGTLSGSISRAGYPFATDELQKYISTGKFVGFDISHTGDIRIDCNLTESIAVSRAYKSITSKVVVYLNNNVVASKDIEIKNGEGSLDSIRIKATETGRIYFEVSVTVELERGASGTVELSTAVNGTYGISTPFSNTFTLTLKQIGFDISKQGSSLSDGLATINMKSGACGGRGFVIQRVKYNASTDDWTCTCLRQKDDSLNQYFPNSIYALKSGDRFVLTDLEMPEIYLLSASQRLYDKSLEVLNRMKSPSFAYAPSIDNIQMARSPQSILEGMYMAVTDDDIIGGTAFVLINTLTIDEGEDIPTFTVALMDERRDNMFQKITGEVRRNKEEIIKIEDSTNKNPYDNPFIPESLDDDEEIVTIESPTDMFMYEEGAEEPTEDGITLTAVLQGFQTPVTYQWYYDEDGVWTALSGATSQSYRVLPSGEDLPYFQDGDGAESFRCVVTSGMDSYYAEKTIVKIRSGSSGYSCFSDNTSHIFSGNETSAITGQTDRINLFLYKGKERIAAKIGTVTGQETGLTATIHDNNTDHPYISVAVTDALTTDGVLSIPVYDGETHIIDLKYSWSVQKKGSKGDPGEPGGDGDPGTDGYNTCIIYLYKRSAETPTIDWTQSLAYSFSEKRITSAAPTGWSKTIPSGDETLYVTAATALSRTDVDTIAYTEWAAPVEFSKNGLNTATVFLFKRSATTLSRSDLPTTDLTYTFASGLLSPSGSLRGWSQSVPSGTDPCYITQATALSVSDTDVIEGGTDGDWSTPVKFVQDGERGLQGAAIRGPQDWDNLFPQGETHSYRFCSGKPDPYPEDAEFLDLAYDDADGHYYMCKLSYTATQSSPRPSADSTHWYQADAQYEFIATRVLLATSAKIKFLSNNEILLMYGNTVTGGAKGAATADDIVFWAGSSNPSASNYRVTRGGKLYATDAVISGTLNAGDHTEGQVTTHYVIQGFGNARITGNLVAGSASLGQTRVISEGDSSIESSIRRIEYDVVKQDDQAEVKVSAANTEVLLRTHNTLPGRGVELKLTASEATLKRSGFESEENIVSAPVIKHIVVDTGSPSGTDENTLYIVI